MTFLKKIPCEISAIRNCDRRSAGGAARQPPYAVLRVAFAADGLAAFAAHPAHFAAHKCVIRIY